MSGIRESRTPGWPRWGTLEPSKVVRRRGEIAVGSMVFVRDENSRVYLDQNSSPEPRHFFVPREVLGETSRSWLVGYAFSPDKHPKSAPIGLYGLDDVEDALWVQTHARRLADRVRSLKDADLLRAIAKIAGFEP